MNNCTQLIQGICESDITIKSELYLKYYKHTDEFVKLNNTHNNTKIDANYIYKSVLGVINMRFTALAKSKRLTNHLLLYNMKELMYFLSRELYRSEVNVINPKKKRFRIVRSVDIKESYICKQSNVYEKDFRELIKTREKELKLINKVVKENSFEEFKAAYFDMAIDIVNKSKSANEPLAETDVQEYARDIFSEAVLKLISLVIEGKYIYEAKISSFMYWPMFNKWAKISREIGLGEAKKAIHDEIDDAYYEDNIEKEELKKFLKENIKKLNKREQEILWLKEIEGYSYQEIKDMLKLDEEINYLKQIKLRGKRNLEAKLREDDRLKEFLQ